MLRPPMKCTAATLAVMLAGSFIASAAPKIAQIRVFDVYKNLESTRLEQEKAAAQRAEIGKDRRIAELQKMMAELEAQRVELKKKDPSAEAATVAKMTREYGMKLQEAQALKRDFDTFNAERQREISREMVAKMRVSLERIRQVAEKLGKEEGFDCVVDSSGDTNSGVPLMLYVKSPVDLTDRVLSALGSSQKPAPVKTSTEDNKR